MRPHGLRGEVVVDFVSNRAERSMPGSVFMTDAGELRIESSRPFRHRWLVNFAGVRGHRRRRSACATGSCGPRRSTTRPPCGSTSWWARRSSNDADGSRLGTVTAVVANPVSDLLELDGGALVPLRCVVDHGPGRIVVDVPPGLFD